MAAMDTISELKPFKNMWKVQVKIIRLWKQYSAAGGETIEMVLLDVRGDKISATVKRELVGKFDRMLQEGETKVLINFTVTNSSGSYRTTKHPFKIVFLPTTRVRICEELSMNLSGLNPVNFRDVLSGGLDDDYLVDVIGQIVEVAQMEIVSVNGKDTQKISIELRNEEDERLPLVLWGKFAEDVSSAIKLHSEQSIVCVLRFGKIKEWKDNRSISNAYNVSSVALNPIMDEVQAFMSLLPKDDLALAIVDSKSNAIVSGIKEKDDFFFHTPRKTIAQVLESKQVEKCIVMASIGAIDSDMGWYYLSCKVCAKKVLTVPIEMEDGDDVDVGGHNYYCLKCKKNNPPLLPRYKLHLVVLDSTNNTKFLLFDNLAMQLLHKPCIELTGPVTDEIQDPDVFPPILNDLVGKTFLFKIGIERENYLYKNPTFKVLKIMTNIGLINEFDAIGSPTESQSTSGGTFSALSDAPEASLILHGGSSQLTESNEMTPAKRSRPPVVNLEDAFDQNSVTRSACTIRVKKEKSG
ncbi:replication protein A 70 kDa DNA-binding subunit C-like [Raphanus sativus]|uniref:Replication protein A 70 kDa DNA-binding subunit C-like n=1 Tax=Raphanus sativus TaxID=3726 RepID=A0A6J0K6J3_RAPSA|nr:replication protein A 70 kDa DNA-binding subunit C-like [Raphanus sativus]